MQVLSADMERSKMYLYKIYDIFLLIRFFNVLQPICLVIAGVILAGGSFYDMHAYMLLTVIVLVHGAVTIWNDIDDVLVDKRNNVSSVFTRGEVTAQFLKKIVLVQLLVVIIILAFLPPLSWVITAILGLLGWQYSAKPIRASRRPVESMLFLALSYGLLPLLLGASLGAINQSIIIIGLFWTLSRVSLSILKDYKDAIGDAKSNKRTFLLRYGHSNVRLISLIGVIIGYCGVIYFITPFIDSNSINSYLISTIFLAGMSIICRLGLFVKSSYRELAKVFSRCLVIQLLTDGILTLWLVASSIS